MFNNIVFSQTTSDDANKNSSAQTTVNSAFENDVNYFSDTTSATGQTAASSNYKAPSTAGMIIKMIVVLVLVIAGLYAILRFIKKRNDG